MTFNPNSLSQRDPRWQDIKLGFDHIRTIGTDGCALTCLAMMANGYGYEETPESLNSKLIKLGAGNGYIGPLMVWAGMTRLYPKIGIKEMYVCSDAKPVPFKRIDSLISNGQTVLVECDRSLATGEQSHWVLLTRKVDNDYIMLDPWSYPPDNREVPLTSRYGYGRNIKDVITAVAFFECWHTIPGKSLLPRVDGLYFRVLEKVSSGLRMRIQPNPTATIISAEIAGAPLLVLEDQGEALAKVGVTDQWINVRDPQGHEGYVAAWYLERLPDDVIQLPPTPEAESKPEIPLPVEPVPQPAFEEKEEPVVIPPVIVDLPPQPVPEITPPLAVKVSANIGSGGLRLRAQPGLDSAVITLLKINEKLVVLEDNDNAQKKIGIQNKWIYVQTARAEKGYCAAWLIELIPPVVEEAEPAQEVKPEEPRVELPQIRVKVSTSLGKIGLRLRSAPVDGPIIQVLPAGALLTVVEDLEKAKTKIGMINQWLQVKDDLGHNGYVAAWFVQVASISQDERPSGGDGKNITVLVSTSVGSSGLRLRSEPSTKAATLQILPMRTMLQVIETPATARAKIGKLNQWLNVRAPNGKDGYVAAWYVLE